MATTLGHSAALDRGKTGVFRTLDALPHPMQGTAPSAVTTTPSTGTTGHGHTLKTVKGPAKTMTAPGVILHNARRQGQPLFS